MNNYRKLVAALFVCFVCGTLKAQTIRTSPDIILVQGSKYSARIERASGILTLLNPQGRRYTRFPLFAGVVPRSGPRAAPALSWEVKPPLVEMTAREGGAQKILLNATLKFQDEAFEVQFRLLPKPADLGYDVSIVNGSWPWGLGVDTSFARHALSISGKKFSKGLGAYPYSNVKLVFRQPVRFRSLEALVGIDDKGNQQGSVIFQVRADNKNVADTGIVRGGEKPKALEAAVAGARTIELIVAEPGNGSEGGDADWGDVRFVTSRGEPVYISDLISRAQQGAKLFSFNDRGFDTVGWSQMFTPEPDDYYSKTSTMVEVRQDVDGDRFFAPAPLNLSFQTPAGWFSIGLLKLPDATGFRFQHGHILIPYPWTKMKQPENRLYELTPLLFTFNRSEWDAISDYRDYLLKNHYVQDIPIEQKQTPAWWMWPLLCTWGEQGSDNATQVKPRFTSDWVKKYVLGQEKALKLDRFTVIIDDKWQRKYGDPRPDPSRFADIRDLVDWIHGRGHKVLLWWRCWYGEPGSLPDQMGLLDKGYIDATHPLFESYVRQSVQTMLGNGPNELDADGLKVDYVFDVRDPVVATYAQPSLGLGIREVYRYADIWYREAKRIKKDCLITFSGPDPHFALVQDMTRINDAGRDPLQRQNRARVSALAAPNLLIDGDSADMSVSLSDYHHIISSAYGVPSLYYLTRYSDGPITEEMHKVTGNIFRLSAMKGPGHPVFKSIGNWQYVRRGEVVAESFQDGTAFVVYPEAGQALVISTKSQDLRVPLHGAVPLKVRTENGNEVRFKALPGGDLVIPGVERGEIYMVSLGRGR